MADKRIQTMHALLLSTAGPWPEYHSLKHELDAVAKSRKMTGKPRGLLTVLHATRLLDSSLRAFLVNNNISLPQQPALGPYLTRLAQPHLGPGQLPGNTKKRFAEGLVKQRNKYMHTADAWPPNHHAEWMLTEVDACLTEVFRL